MSIKQKEKWITIGDNNGPSHMHINTELILFTEFVEEEKPGRTSFSVRFFDQKGEHVLSAFFTKIYDQNNELEQKTYDNLCKKYNSKIKF